ncbi:MAG: zinc-ribbon domain-containing protein [Planctomycetota bacterium]|nr:zinc-ribbon domain-containing protein [Planctomycetota bacterium]
MARTVLIVIVLAAVTGACLAGVCPNCKGQIPDGSNFCPSCGAKVQAACARCGAPLGPGAKFCPQCGQKVEGGPGSPPAPGEPAGGAETAPVAASRPAGPFDPRNVEADRQLLTFGAFTNEQVEQMIRSASDRILSAQQIDGSWEPILMYQSARSGIGTGGPPPGQKPIPMHQMGVTAMAVYALLEGGLTYHDPRMKKALDWLEGTTSDQTYDVAFRANAYQAAVRQGGVQYRKPLQQDAKLLIEKSNHGGYSYFLRPPGRLGRRPGRRRDPRQVLAGGLGPLAKPPERRRRLGV